MAADSPISTLRLRLTDGDQKERQAETALAAAVESMTTAARMMGYARSGAEALVGAIALAPEARAELGEHARLFADAGAVMSEMMRILQLMGRQMGMSISPFAVVPSLEQECLQAAERGALAEWERQLIREKAVVVMAGGG